MVVPTEDERKRVERHVAPKPRVFRRMRRDLGLEELTVGSSNEAIDTVRANDEIGALELGEILDFSLELQPHPERAAPPLEDAQQHLARDAGKDVPARADLGVAVINVDRIPPREALADLGVGLVIGIAQCPERLLGKHHAPSEGGVGWIALHHQDVVARV